MKIIMLAAGALLIAAAPAFAVTPDRAAMAPGGDPDLDLTVNPDRAHQAAPRIQRPDVDDGVYLPGLTEGRGEESAGMSQYRGVGGPIDEAADYPPCSATLTDRCTEIGGLK